MVTSPDILIRDATSDDAMALAQIHLDARATAMPWLAKVHSDQEVVAWMTDQVIPRQRVRVAALHGAVAGFAVFENDWLDQLYVKPDNQRLGIGTLLFNDVYAAAIKPFRFWVFQRNTAARHFYEQRGCHLIKITDGKDNEEHEPDALYEKSIP